MPLSVESEVEQIETMTDLRHVKDKRTSRKGQLTRIAAQARLLVKVPTKKLRVSELQKKLEEANRSSTLFDVLQTRFEALASEQRDFDMESEIAQGNDIRTENEVTTDSLVCALERVELYRQGLQIVQSLTDIIEVKVEDTSYTNAEIQRLGNETDKFRSQAEIYEEDEDIHAIAQRLTVLKRKALKLVKSSDSHSSIAAESATPQLRIQKDRFKLQPPTFDGRPLEWKRFIKLFKAIISKDPSLDEAEKACLLANAMTNPQAKELVKDASSGDDPFETALEALRAKYGKERVIYREHLKALMVDRTFGYNRKDLNFIFEHWSKHLRGLEDCGGLNQSNIFATLLELKFGDDLRHQWNVGGMSSEKPSRIEELLEFIKTRSDSDLIDEEPQESQQQASAPPPKKSKPPPPRTEPRREASHRSTQPPTFKCMACKEEGHTLSRCDTFKSWDFNRKNQLVRDNKLCLNCFSNRHAVRDCKSLYSCRTCSARHHTLLHKDSTSTTSGAPVSLILDGSQYLTTAIVMAKHGDYRQKARVVLDSGACVNVVTEDLARRLKAKRLPCSEQVNFGPFPHVIKSFVELQLSSIHEEGVSNTIRAYIIPSIPSARPPANASQLLELPFIKGKTPIADPELGGPVDILLSTRDGGDCIIGGSLQYKNPTTTLTRTIFGWTLGGGTTSHPSQWAPVLSVHPDDTELFDSLQRLWQLDCVPPRETPLMNDEEQQAVEHFRTTHKVLESGRFSVQLPRKTPTPTLGESRPAAVRRYIQNEKTLQKRGQLGEFQDVLKEYLILGHAEKVPPNEISTTPSASFYLPVHGVIKESSTTTRLRAVFDASAQTSSGVSLNEQL